MKKKFKKIKLFFSTIIWTVDVDNMPRPKRDLIKISRTLSLGIRGFREDNLNVRASALTYFTMLSIVPVLALGFGIAKGFGLDAVLENELAKNLAGQEQALEYILQFVRSMLNTAKGGVVAGIGLIVLIWSVMKLLTNIERSFNTVWEVKKSRALIRKFTDYFSIMLVAPILMILSSSISIFISSQLSEFGSDSILSFISPIGLKFAKIIPFLIIWALFTLLYLVMPNTKVKFKSALIAGITAGTIFQLFQVLYVFFQAGATRINAIYGSFAALPLFLIWLQISWFVVLMGAEISFAVQNVKMKGSELRDKILSISYQKKLALLITKNIIIDFSEGNTPPTAQQIANKTTAPYHTVEFILNNLVNSNILSKVVGSKKEYSYQPARSIDKIDVISVISKYEDVGDDHSKYIQHEDFEGIVNKFELLRKKSAEAKENTLVKNIND